MKAEAGTPLRRMSSPLTAETGRPRRTRRSRLFVSLYSRRMPSRPRRTRRSRLFVWLP